MDDATGPAGTVERITPELRRMEVERRRELVEGMMHLGISVRQMVDALAKHVPPILTSKSRVGDDVVTIKRRWVERYTDSYETKASRIWSVLTRLEESLMPAAIDGDPRAAREVRLVQDQKARMIGAYQPEVVQLVGAGGGPIVVEHSLSAEAKIARGRAIVAELLGPPKAIDVASYETPSTNGSNGHGSG